jgi:AraC-like DNA-binding protein
MTKPQLLKIQENTASSLDIRYEKVSYFNNPWHYHPEIELTLVTKSTGMRFVGDSVERFEAGDLVLLGSNLPHYWRNDKIYYQENAPSLAEAIILRFRYDLWGNDFLVSPEIKPIKTLLEYARQGILFSGNASDKILPILNRILVSKGVGRIIGWLEVFEILTQEENTRLLSQKSFGTQKHKDDSNRINKVLAYIQDHLAEQVNLSDVAGIADMNKASFCRYFKEQTNKTFIELLNDIRIANACRLLLENSQDIAEIGYQCGFENISHFNYMFKKITGQNPTTYRKEREV